MMRFTRPLRHARFRRVWYGQAISSIGDGIFNIAMISVVLLHHRYADLGFVLAAESAAMVVMSLLGGAVADRMRRARAMALSDGVQLLAVLGFILGVAAGPLLLILPFAALMGIGSAMFQPAFGALIPSLVPDEDLSAANALKSTTTKLAAVIGPGLGGLLLATCGYRVAFMVDLGTFVVSIGTLIGLKDPVPERGEPGSVFRDARAGLAAVRDRPWVMTVILQGTVQLLLVMGPAVVLLPILLKERGMFDAYGVMVGLEAAGYVLGGLAASAWKPRWTGVVGVGALSLLGLQLLALLLRLPVYVLGCAVLATGFGYALFGVLWTSALQRAFPDHLLGRALSVEMLGTFALAPVGLALTPLAMNVLGDKAILIAALVVLAVSTVIPLFQRAVRTFGSGDPATSELVAVPAVDSA
ncbi:MAG: MFS transporter [Streptosporangiaceae bacterium]|nr:MFS transporter [Streptosporangiaceae bacterium]